MRMVGAIVRARPNIRWAADRVPVVVTVAALAATIALAGCRSSSSGPSSAAPPAAIQTPTTAGSSRPDAATAAQVSTTAVPTTTVPARPTTTTTPPVPTTVSAPPTAPPTTSPYLQAGSTGTAVVQLQQRLSSLGYWLGPVDGQFGGTTQQAVWAIQKSAGIPRTGIVDPATTAALATGTVPKSKSSSGHTIEVDLSRQLVLIVTNGHLDAALNTSTGGGYVYYDQGARQVATTPTGQFTTFSEVDGTRISSLGVLWRPKFFVGGIAIHGDTDVPPRPVSHGCVRVSNAAIDWIWDSNTDPIGTAVWVY